MDINDLGYFIYMDQCEKGQDERQSQHLIVNVISEDDLEEEEATQNEKYNYLL